MMSLQKKECLINTIVAICAVLYFSFAYNMEKKGMATYQGVPLFFVNVIVMLIVLIYLLYISNSEATYFSLSKEVATELEKYGEVMKIKDVEQKKAYSGITEYDISISRIEVSKTVVIDGGKEMRVEEYYFPGDRNKKMEWAVTLLK